MSKPRKPHVFTRTTLQLTREAAREHANLPQICAWDGCTNIFDGPMPPDWVQLLTYWAPTPQVNVTLGEISASPFCTRDTSLCPEHARALEALLRPMASREMDTPAGSA